MTSKVTEVTCAFDNLPDSPGSSREHGGLIQAHATHINHMEAVHVLARGNSVADCTFVNVFCQKTEKSYGQDANILFK